MATALTKIVAHDPVPLLCMRTIMKAFAFWPKLVDLAMELLRALLARRVWTMAQLWAGFPKCCQLAMPHSYPVTPATPVRHSPQATAPPLPPPQHHPNTTAYTAPRPVHAVRA